MGLRHLVVVILFVVLSCGGSGPTTPAIAVFPEISGLYVGHRLWQITQSRNSDGVTRSVSCSGSLTLNQSNATMNGDFVVGGPCPVASGTVEGFVFQDGTVQFTWVFVDNDDDSLLARLTGCNQIREGVRFVGMIANGTIDAVMNASALCGGEESMLTTRISGSSL